jgi:hypothetical protein
MDDLNKIILTSSLTVLGGVIVFVAGQLIGKFVIEPIHELKKLLGEIHFGLVFYAQAIQTPGGERVAEDEASKALRKMACDLLSKVAAIPFYGFWSVISRGFLPHAEQIEKASSCVIGLSNSIYQDNRYEKNPAIIAKIERLLNFKHVNE